MIIEICKNKYSDRKFSTKTLNLYYNWFLNNKEIWIKGEELEFVVGNSTVRKYINLLRCEGVPIISDVKKGYKYTNNKDEPAISKEMQEIIEAEDILSLATIKMEYHPYANIFPMLPQDELEALANDISENGLINKIALYDTKILDGRNRYEACLIAKYKPEFIDVDVDPLNYVISANLKRRQLNASQRSLIAADLANMKVGGKSANLPNCNPISQEQAAKLLNVSERSVRTAKQLKEKHPERIVEIQTGKKTVSAIAKETKKRDQIAERRSVATKLKLVKDENLYFGDCVEVLKQIKPNTVDCVVMDPPYLIDYKDTRESFNPTFNDSSENKESTLDDWFKAIKRVIKPDAHIYCFYGMDEDNTFYNVLSKYFNVRVRPIIWVKNNHTMGGFDNKYMSKYEPIYFCSNDKRLLNNKVSPDVLEFSIPTNKLHKTQKPLDLCEYLIKNSTVENEIVLDPFMGSGTTCLAAKNTNRKYIGIEKDEDIFNIAIERLKN